MNYMDVMCILNTRDIQLPYIFHAEFFLAFFLLAEKPKKKYELGILSFHRNFILIKLKGNTRRGNFRCSSDSDMCVTRFFENYVRKMTRFIIVTEKVEYKETNKIIKYIKY